jgi:hypothetical protein
MTGGTATSPRPGGLVTGAVDAVAMIGLARVEKVYSGRRGVGFSALSGVDVAISVGEMVAITGPSGGTEIGLDRAVTGSAVPYIPAAQAALIAAALTFAAIMTSFAAMSRHSA